MNSEYESSDEITEYLAMLDDIDKRNQQRVLRFDTTVPGAYNPDKVNIIFHG